MRRRTAALLYLLLLCLVVGAAVGLRSREGRRADSPIPSVHNPGAQGVKALYTYLVETGADPGILETRFTTIPKDAGVIVSLAPTQRFIGLDQWKTIRAWVREGHTFVYGVPRRVRTQYIETNLSLRWVFGPRPTPLLNAAALEQELKSLLGRGGGPADPNGADAVPWLPSPLLAGVTSLRVAADDGVDTDVSRVEVIAGAGSTPSVVVIPDGEGEVVVLAGADLAENRRIALGDNLAFWLNLARRGRIYFDEYHHQALEGPRRGIFSAAGPVLLQLLFGALLLALAAGRRLGEPRPVTVSRRRSQGEYVSQLAQLYAAGRLQGPLCAELLTSLRRTLFERLGISAHLDDLEVARRLEQRTGIGGERYLALARRSRELAAGATDRELAALSRDFALLEREIGW